MRVCGGRPVTKQAPAVLGAPAFGVALIGLAWQPVIVLTHPGSRRQ